MKKQEKNKRKIESENLKRNNKKSRSINEITEEYKIHFNWEL